MQQTLYKNITDFTRKFKLNQEIYSKKYKEFAGEEDPTYEINSTMREDTNDSNKIDNFLMTDNSDLVLQRRDNELNQLLNSVNDLAQIFKDMQTLVMEQGSILDRIDYNIDIASENTKNAYSHINEANKLQKQSCFRNATLIIMVIIFIEAIILINKYL